MKSWSRLCLLVLAISSLSRGQIETPTSNEDHDKMEADTLSLTPSPLSPDKTENEANSPTPPYAASQNRTAMNATEGITTPQATLATGDYKPMVDNITGEEDISKTAQTTIMGGLPGSRGTGYGADVISAISLTTTSASAKPVPTEDIKHPSSSMGYVILALMIVLIIALCVILYILRRVSRTYSFDLQRPVPTNHLTEPIGTFEPVYLDDLERPAPKDQVTTDDLSPPPAANGTTLQPEDKGSSGENNALQGQPGANGVEMSLTSNTSPSLGDDPADKTSSPLSEANLLFDAVGEEQQNENNNNNPSVCSSDPFVEINLDDPAWCDQLLTSPEAPSSVLPFTPFSFSSSSSSS